MNETEFIYDAFKRYFQRGTEAKERGDYDLAKTELLLAAENLKKLADNSSGILRTTRMEQVSNILDAIENMGKAPIKTTNNSPARDIESSETVWQSVQIPNQSLDDIAGLEEVKKAARDMIIDVFKYEQIYKKYRYMGGGGILMCGLPGNGKTAIARAIAGEAGCKFFNVRPSDIKSKWQGEAVRNIRNLFATARQEDRAIIFFDDMDPLAKDRALLNDNTSSEILTELLTQMEGFEKHMSKLLVIGATNVPWELDTAIYSRFKRIIYVPMPDMDARSFIIKREIKGIPTEENFDIACLADVAEGYSGRDIVSLCHYAKSLPLQRDKEKLINLQEADSQLLFEDFIQAFNKVKPSVKEKDKQRMKIYLDDNKDKLL